MQTWAFIEAPSKENHKARAATRSQKSCFICQKCMASVLSAFLLRDAALTPVSLFLDGLYFLVTLTTWVACSRYLSLASETLKLLSPRRLQVMLVLLQEEMLCSF